MAVVDTDASTERETGVSEGGDQKSEDVGMWGVREGVPRHGEVAIRAAADASWELRAAEGDSGLGILTGHFAVFNRWTEIDSFFEGRFLEQIAPGAFSKTFNENQKGMRCLFQHGKDPSVGMKPLGPIRALEQDDFGARYDVELLDADYVRELKAGLEKGLYGASFRFQVVKEEVNTRPERSEHNPEGIEERTITEAKVREFGPVTFPAYDDATAGIRSMNDRFWDLELATATDPERLAHFLDHLRAGGARTTRQIAVPDASSGGTRTTRQEPVEPDASSSESSTPEPPKDEPARPQTLRRGSTRLKGAAAALRTSRKLEEPKWKL